MKGLSMNEFYNALFYGADIDFKYGSMYYHINAGVEHNGKHGITVFKFDKHPDETPSIYDEIYNVSHGDTAECVETFLNAKLFECRSIYEIESNVEILYS